MKRHPVTQQQPETNSGHEAVGVGIGLDGGAALRITADADEWSASHDGLGTSTYCGIRDADGTVVALAVAHLPDYGDPDCRSMAERIVHCVNTHSGLLEACRAIVAWDEAEKNARAYEEDNGKAYWQRIAMCADAFDKAREALAKALGGQQ